MADMITIQEQNKEELQRAILVGVCLDSDNSDYLHAMEELRELAKACEMEVVAIIEQNMASPNPATYVGSGKVQEIAETVNQLEADYVIFEDTLSPSQLKNVQKEINASVMDRTNLILEIFSRRAKTREARLQVESANLQYILPRLVGMRESLGRQGGASGSMSNKGSGEKQIELDRRRIEKRISELRRELEAIEHDRQVKRGKRMQSAVPQVSLVGYTNAGKSTLLNRMLGRYVGKEEKKVMEKDMLFATLDTTVRRIAFENHKDFLLSDTVGFISHLPHTLVKAFHSTLEEVTYADLLLEVVDLSDEHYRDHMQVTKETLKELGAEEIPILYVMNKADRLYEVDTLPRINGDTIYMSASLEAGLPELVEMIQKKLYASNKRAVFLIPYAKGDIDHYLNENGHVFSKEYTETGILLDVDCREADYHRFSEYLVR